MIKRKPIQIAVSAGATGYPDLFYVLAHDGSMWWRRTEDEMEAEWKQMPDLPPIKESSDE